ncbi:MAG TPA: VWA domain-containing protein [Xanthobacteraceae bacterium]|nr:VWA domain-containing protein [Xanthobacteraceae bacterium]
MPRVRRFLADTQASVLPLFAFTVVTVMAMMGAAVDYSRANATKAAFQAALDSTVLAMAEKANDTAPGDLQTQAQSYFDALFSKYGAAPVTLDVSYTTANGSELKISGETTIKTQFMRLSGLGIDEIKVGGSATAHWGNTRMRVALALDNTGSMANNGKMTALKAAAKGLIDQLKAAAANDGDVYVAVIPFSKDVNVGPDNGDASWLKWADWNSANGTCSDTRYRTKTKCEANGKIWTVASSSDWNGCVTDRDQPYDTTNDPPTSIATRFPTEQYSSCPVALMPLSYDWTALKDRIEAMQPAGNTNTTIGLEWAWHSLSQGDPLNAPAEDANYQYKKVIIFLTDGVNTENRWTQTSSRIDERMQLACDNAKADGVTIYTVRVIDGNEQLLKYCASSSDKYYGISASNQLVDAFAKIGTNLTRLHLSR